MSVDRAVEIAVRAIMFLIDATGRTWEHIYVVALTTFVLGYIIGRKTK